MSFIYHGVPERMEGSTLLPLNQMQATYPKLHAKYLEKYQGRKEILERKIPLLNCLWNDVIQFLPLHPRTVFALQADLGIIPTIPAYKYFEIDTAGLDLDKTVVFFKTAPGEENVTVKWWRDVDPKTLQEIPEATINYFKSVVGTGEGPFNYQFIPHVLHMGTVDVSSAPIITL